MRILKWLSLLNAGLILGQEKAETLSYSDNLGIDSITFINLENSFSENDNQTLLGFDLFESSILSNFGSPLLPLWWKPKHEHGLKIGDLLLENNLPKNNFGEYYSYRFPQTKIIYSQAYSDGQRLNFIHKKRYRYGSVSLNYNRLVSQGLLSHEQVKNTKFILEGNFSHPKIPYESKWRIRTYKNETEWNGGVSNDSLFIEGTQSNWAIIPVNWTSLKTQIKHLEINGNQLYRLSDQSKFIYEINISRDSIFYEGLSDDSLFYPSRSDSISEMNRSFNYSNHLIKWIQKFNDKLISLGFEYQKLKNLTQTNKQWNTLVSIKSTKFQNKLYLSYGNSHISKPLIDIFFIQSISLFGLSNKFKISYQRNNPTWMNMNTGFSNFNSGLRLTDKIDSEGIIYRNTDWLIKFDDIISLQNTYHNIKGYMYFNELGISTRLNHNINIFQSKINHKISNRLWNWTGSLGFQFSSQKAIPLPKILLNHKIYWQGSLFKEATICQMGIRLLYKSSHPGMTYAPFIGDFYINPESESNQTIRTDLFANFQIQSLKIYLFYEHFNGLWQGEQYIIKPYPMAKPTFRLGLIWNFYD